MGRKAQMGNCCSYCTQKQMYEINTTEELLSLMNIYYSEWSHRDSLMWKQICTFFFAVFVVIILPFAKIWEIRLTEVIPEFWFPIVGIILSLIFLYITIQYAHRLSKISDTYREVIEHLPEEFRRKSMYGKDRITILNKLAYIVPIIMFLSLMVFATVVLILCIVN